MLWEFFWILFISLLFHFWMHEVFLGSVVNFVDFLGIFLYKPRIVSALGVFIGLGFSSWVAQRLSRPICLCTAHPLLVLLMILFNYQYIFMCVCVCKYVFPVTSRHWTRKIYYHFLISNLILHRFYEGAIYSFDPAKKKHQVKRPYCWFVDFFCIYDIICPSFRV